MKKFVMVVTVALLAVMTSIVLVGCSSKLSTGTYKFSKMTGKMEGVEIEVEVGEKLMGMITLSEDYVTLEIKDDGKAVLTMTGQPAVDCEWMEEDGKYYLVVGTDKTEITVDGNTIKFEEEGMMLELKKK